MSARESTTVSTTMTTIRRSRPLICARYEPNISRTARPTAGTAAVIALATSLRIGSGVTLTITDDTLPSRFVERLFAFVCETCSMSRRWGR